MRGRICTGVSEGGSRGVVGPTCINVWMWDEGACVWGVLKGVLPIHWAPVSDVTVTYLTTRLLPIGHTIYL